MRKNRTAIPRRTDKTRHPLSNVRVIYPIKANGKEMEARVSARSSKSSVH